jgi:hypothetical protein
MRCRANEGRNELILSQIFIRFLLKTRAAAMPAGAGCICLQVFPTFAQPDRREVSQIPYFAIRISYFANESND